MSQIATAAMVALVGAVSVARAQPAPDPARFDLMGIRIGMAPRQVLDALHAYDPFMTQPLVVRAISGPGLPGGETLRAIDAFRTASVIADGSAAKPAGAGSEQIVVLFTRRLPARVYAVAHVLSYDPSQVPQRTAFVAVLASLYGDPIEHHGTSSEETLRWVYDGAFRHPDPASPPGRALLDACAERGYRTAAQEVGQSETPFSAVLQVSEGGDPACGLRMRVRVLTDGVTVTRFFQDMVSDTLAQEDAEHPSPQVAQAPVEPPEPPQPARPPAAPPVAPPAAPPVVVAASPAVSLPPEATSEVDAALRRRRWW